MDREGFIKEKEGDVVLTFYVSIACEHFSKDSCQSVLFFRWGNSTQLVSIGSKGRPFDHAFLRGKQPRELRGLYVHFMWY
jgi:hypothetical protein